MIHIPEDYIAPLARILEWHLKAYMPEVIFDTRTKRILDKLYKTDISGCGVTIEGNEIYYIKECAANAINNPNECGIDKELSWEIFNWASREHREHK